MIIRIATRQSPLALWQAHQVSALLCTANPTVETQLVTMETLADQRLDVSISELGGKGAFSKEVQALLLSDQADIAVHSAKDLQAVTPEGLTIAAFPERGDVRDALVGANLHELPAGATVATGSNRRRVQLAHLRPDLEFVGLRGNIATRLGKLDQFHALVMASAALARLGISPTTLDIQDPSVIVPQVGQGALAVECRTGDTSVLSLLSAIDHPPTRVAVEAERGFLVELGGDCDLPAGAHAEFVDEGRLRLRAVLASEDETQLERTTVVGDPPFDDPGSLGAKAARKLRDRVSV